MLIGYVDPSTTVAVLPNDFTICCPKLSQPKK